MGEQLRELLDEELAAAHAPPVDVDGLVAGALRRGRGIRRRRRLGVLASAAGMAGVVAIGGLIGAQRLTGGHPATSAAGQVVLGTATATATAPAAPIILPGGAPINQPPVARTKPTTSAAIAYLLTGLVAPAHTGTASQINGNPLAARLNVMAPDGEWSPISVVVHPNTRLGGIECPESTGSSHTECEVLGSGGGPVAWIMTSPQRCDQAQAVFVDHGNGVVVEVDLATCRLDTPQPTRTTEAVSQQTALTLAADPRWGLNMDSRLVDDGASHFPQLAVG